MSDCVGPFPSHLFIYIFPLLILPKQKHETFANMLNLRNLQSKVALCKVKNNRPKYCSNGM